MPLDKVELKLSSGGSWDTVKVTSYTLRYDMFLGAGDFKAEIDHAHSVQPQMTPVQFKWYINDQEMMCGYVEIVDRVYRKGEVIQNIRGRDMCQLLIDNYVLNPTPYKDKPLVDLVNTIIRESSSEGVIHSYNNGKLESTTLNNPLRIVTPNIYWNPNALTVAKKIVNYKKFRTTHGQTLFDAISTICNQVGLYLYNVPGTNNIMIHLAFDTNTSNLVSYDRVGNISTESPYDFGSLNGRSGVISARTSIDTTSYHKLIRLIGQTQSEMELSSDETKPFEIIKNSLWVDHVSDGYNGLTKFLSQTLHTADLSAWNKAQQNLIDTILLNETRKLFNIEYIVAGHSPVSGGNPYFFKHMALINDVQALPGGVSNLNMMVYKVEFRGSKNEGTTTTLEMCLPKAFDHDFYSENFPVAEQTLGAWS